VLLDSDTVPLLVHHLHGALQEGRGGPGTQRSSHWVLFEEKYTRCLFRYQTSNFQAPVESDSKDHAAIRERHVYYAPLRDLPECAHP